MKPAVVRYYFDADILGLAKVVASLRSDATYPGARARTVRGRLRPACVVTSADTADTDWIPTVAAEGMVAITRDSRIERRPAERAAILDAGARGCRLVRRPLDYRASERAHGPSRCQGLGFVEDGL